MSLTIKWKDTSGLDTLAAAMQGFSSQQRAIVFAAAVKHTGDKARTKVTRALAEQTGLKYGTIRKAAKVKAKSSVAIMSYEIITEGGDISLRFFKARETRAGVVAAPFGKATLFEGAWKKGGKFPNRVETTGLGGHVYRRAVGGRGPLALQNSGVVIPVEMLQGMTREAFTKTVDAELPKRVMHEINRMSRGIFA